MIDISGTIENQKWLIGGVYNNMFKSRCNLSNTYTIDIVGTIENTNVYDVDKKKRNHAARTTFEKGDVYLKKISIDIFGMVSMDNQICILCKKMKS